MGSNIRIRTMKTNILLILFLLAPGLLTAQETSADSTVSITGDQDSAQGKAYSLDAKAKRKEKITVSKLVFTVDRLKEAEDINWDDFMVFQYNEPEDSVEFGVIFKDVKINNVRMNTRITVKGKTKDTAALKKDISGRVKQLIEKLRRLEDDRD